MTSVIRTGAPVAAAKHHAESRRTLRCLPTPNRLVVIEFPSMEQAKRWYDCEEYRAPKAMRLRAGRTNLVFVEGV
jgi:uncharacterized protein (DUF1330 family)